ncbi:NADH-ubiquinone oxidoreductase subunit, mitochondrial [Sphaceloma murrayae]|uniref:NADH-ubiquinone oxidoreductase subunit, mitochondrial n=1 Tax=Sphaceloma murrayae TaxID=2082308 RepID=A0A2K1QJ88_9PEZI|nr:NADH-ubiquinone oxidoreductase subunit, mitochondrial [Sphaceloma murrayae]
MSAISKSDNGMLPQPKHRRLSFMKTASKWSALQNARNESPTSKSRPECDEPMGDSFDLDPKYLVKYELPQHLRKSLPDSLIIQVDRWSGFAAAIQTKITHLRKLDLEDLDVAWPVDGSSVTTSPINSLSSDLSRVDSDLWDQKRSTNPIIPTPPMSMPASKANSFIAHDPADAQDARPALLRVRTDSQSLARSDPAFAAGCDTPPDTPPERRIAAQALDTPPQSPTRSPGGSTLTSGSSLTAGSVASDGGLFALDLDSLKLDDVDHSFLTDASSGITSPITSPVRPHGDRFDPDLWKEFENRYATILEAIKTGPFYYLHHGHNSVERKYRELVLDGQKRDDGQAPDAKALASFKVWWDFMKVKEVKLEYRLYRIQVPTLTEVVEMRKLYGLPADITRTVASVDPAESATKSQ